MAKAKSSTPNKVASKTKSSDEKKPSSRAKSKTSAGKSAKSGSEKAAAATKAKKTSSPASKTGKASSGKSAVSKKKVAVAKKGAAKTSGNNVGSMLVVVESPAKAKTIEKYLGGSAKVMASVGHVKDLPKSKIGVDVENDFAPEYVVIRGKGKILSDLCKAAKHSDVVYLAPDPDREGEAIAWHLADEIRSANSNIRRVLFNEITQRGITEAISNPTDLDHNKYDAQQTRRVLDRLVGYQISPILWAKVRRGLSAGRVQSVAVRIIVDREAEIDAFRSEEYWTVQAEVEGKNPPRFWLRLAKIDDKKPDRLDEATAKQIAAAVRKSSLKVAQVERKERRKLPTAPFITSKLQQEAARKLRFTAKRTMGIAQRLYEGVELGAEGRVGLITYMRTDSTRISADALVDVRNYIGQRFGKDAVPDEPLTYKSKKTNVQDAHEAIRPTSTKYDPETVRKLLREEATKNPERARDIDDQIKLYQLIWNRFVASQMKPAVFDQTTLVVEVKDGSVSYEFRASGQVLRSPGFTLIYTETEDEDAPAQEPGAEGDRLPNVQQGEVLSAQNVTAEQHFSSPPPRFTEASLVKELEEKGIGRPSTYAAILSTIQDRGYVEKKEGRFHPTDLGKRVNELLVQSFPRILNVDFTAQMESDLDEVEEGHLEMLRLLQTFYEPFKTDVEKAHVEMKDLKRVEIPTELSCEKCGQPMVIKWGRNGEFLACSGYPECKNTKEFTRKKDGTIELVPEPTTDEKCPKCAAELLFRRGRFGEFWACSRYPECKTTRPVSLGIACPKPDCGGFLTEKRSRRGSPFFGCSNYSAKGCDFVSWDRPIKEPCPDCNAPFLLKKAGRAGTKLRCASCTYQSEQADNDLPDAGGDEASGEEDEAA